jgi:KDO2-lipid IV(A) lauroyltransferase
LAYHLMRSGTRALIENFSVVRPHDDTRTLEELALRTYRSYARDTIDFIRSLQMRPDQLQRLLLHDDAGRLTDLLRNGRGVILAGAHFGNWELGGIALRLLKNCSVTVVGRSEPSAAVGELRRQMRERFGIGSVEIGHTLETALTLRRLLTAGNVVAMLIDRHVGRDRIEVNFFGRLTPFLRSPALVAGLSNVPLLPASMIRQPDGRFVGWFGDAVYVDPSQPGEAGLREATQALAAQLEAQIRQHPHLWYQFYPYWSR